LIFLAEALILRSSWRSANSMADLQQASLPTVAAPYGLDDLAYDLKSIQAATVAKTFVDRKVDFTGHESRVYKYAVSQLAPKACQSITALDIITNEPTAGLLMTGTCFNSAEIPAGVKIFWRGREATIVIDGFERSGRLDVLIHPPAPGDLPPTESDQPVSADEGAEVPVDGQADDSVETVDQG
jgi:hypothetical protein